MTDGLQSSTVNKKRDASSPLQDPNDTYKRTKQASETSLSDIDESFTTVGANDTEPISFPDLPETDDPDVSGNSTEPFEKMASRLSDEDIGRIAAAVRSIMIPDMQAIIDKRVDALKTEYDGKVKWLQTDNNKLRKRITDLETENADLRGDVEDMQTEIDDIKWRSDELEQYSRRNSFRISGIAEDDIRSTDDIVIEIANRYNINVDINDIDRSHRVGTKSAGRNRAILVKCTSYRAKRAFMEKKQDLGDNLYFNDDLTKLRSTVLYKARKVFKADRLNGAWSFNGKVFVKDEKDVKHEVKSETDVDKLSSKRPIERKNTSAKGTASSIATTQADPNTNSHTTMDD